MKKQLILNIGLLILMLAMISGVSAENSTNIELTIDSEYNENTNPEILITHEDNKIEYEKINITSFNKFNIKINNYTNGDIYHISVSKPGYNVEEKNIAINSPLNKVNFKLKPNDSYKIGTDVTKAANNLLDFSSADDILVITTAGMVRVKGKTSEDALEGILNQASDYISYGKGNILTLSATRTDPINFAFFVKKENKLTMAFFKNGSTNPIYHGTAGPEISGLQWKELQKLLGNEDAYSYISIANAWSAGIPRDILTQASYHGHVCTGLISGQAMIQALLTYYPPRGESGLPLENTAYYVLGVPGGSEDDAFTWSMDITPGKRAYIGIDTMVNKTSTGFIRWNTTTKTGIIIIMSYDEKKIKSRFQTIYKLDPDISPTNDLKYQNWLMKELKNNPISLVDILYEFKGLNQENLYYLMGKEIGKGNVSRSAHGLDMDYILGLNLEKASREMKANNEQKKLSENKLKQIGIDASKMAVNYFESLGMNIEKDYSKLFVLTSAGYVRINGTNTQMVFEGIKEVLGSSLNRKTLLPVHTALWKDLLFDFFWVDNNNNTNTLSYSLKYDSINDKLIITGNSSEEKVRSNYIIQQVLKYDPPYDALIGWLFHNHVCGGSSPGYLISDYIYEKLPLVDENESYIYITTNANCKDDVIPILLGISPGMGTYYNLRYDNSITNRSNVGIAIKWNSVTKTGELIIISWKGPKFKKGSSSYEEYIKLYKGDYTSKNLISGPNITTTSRKPINEEMFKKIISGATSTKEGNSIDYIMNLPDKLPSVPPTPKKPTQYEDNNGTTIQHDESSSSSNNPLIETGIYKGVQTSAGISGNILTGSVSEDDISGAENGKNSYEVSKKVSSKNVKTNDLIYAVILVLIIGAIAGYGFVRNKK